MSLFEKLGNDDWANVDFEEKKNNDIAVVGMAVQLPGIQTLDEFWSMLVTGKDCVGAIPENRKYDVENYMNYLSGWKNRKLQFPEQAYLREVDKFDHEFFEISPKEASLIDPHQRLFLQCAWRAIEDAGYDPYTLKGSNMGIFLGHNDDSLFSYKRFISEIEPSFIGVAIPGNLKSVIASRISYFLDLKGPSVVVDTACSSSLVAVHLACQSLLRGECDTALVGGVKINLVPQQAIENYGILSKTGRARAFDNKADGTSNGEGAGVVLLKLKDKAVKQKDHIYSLIKGSAINQDGTSIGITAPNAASQAAVIEKAWKRAKVNPETISYIEAHGTGTQLGDPLEIEGIKTAFEKFSDKKQFCGIGSVKTNLGHMDSAAGIVSFIKAALCLTNEKLPPSIHFQSPNREIAFHRSPVYINNQLTDWEKQDNHPLRCGVSSFGLSGTNCHVVLEEHVTSRKPAKQDESFLHIFTLSGKTSAALLRIACDYEHSLQDKTAKRLQDICFTSNVGRSHFRFRVAILCRDITDLQQKLATFRSGDREEWLAAGIYHGTPTLTTGRPLPAEHAEQYPDESGLRKLCQDYIEGKLINWGQLYRNLDISRVALPSYSFERTRCWLDIPLPDNLLNMTFWVKDSLENHMFTGIVEAALVFKAHNRFTLEYEEEIMRRHDSVFFVSLGSEYQKIDARNYVLDENEESFQRLIREIKDMSMKISHIYHFSSLNIEPAIDLPALEGNMFSGTRSLYYLIRALFTHNLKRDITFHILTQYANDVTKEERYLIPENSAFYGFCKSIKQEYANYCFNILDIDEPTAGGSLFNQWISSKPSFLACRDNQIYREEWMPTDLSNYERSKTRILPEGVYLISGGLGGMGYEIAKWLLSKYGCNVALVGRSAKPEGPMDYTAMNDKASRWQELSSVYNQVEYYEADIADYVQMSKVIHEIKRKFGNINGIFHCAGQAGGGVLAMKPPEQFLSVLNPKIQGTWILDHLTADQQTDFMFLFSSAVTLMGAPGQSDYSAANAYLDIFQATRSRLGKKTVTMNWAAWKDVGMAVDNGIDFDEMSFEAIPSNVALQTIDNLLNFKVDRVIIAKSKSSKQCKPAEYSHESPLQISLTGREDNDYSPLEREIAQIWGKVLGLESLCINDNFYELGGNSLLILKLELELEKRNYLIDKDDLLNHNSIKMMSKFLASKLQNNGKEMNEYEFDRN